MEIPSKLIQDAVNEFSRLPGIGKKTALRLVLHLLRQDKEKVRLFGEAVQRMRNEIRYCANCHNISDGDICLICQDHSRNDQLICVVENFKEVIAIENTHQFHGRYHILGGVISPVDGIGPDQLNIDSLCRRVKETGCRELVMALNPNMEGDTTVFYISKKINVPEVKITTISRGVSFGGDLEYVDELTLGRSILSRLPYEKYLIDR